MDATKKLRQRAINGDADAAFRIGYRCAFGRNRGQAADWREAVQWWNQSARANHSRALFCLGTCYDFAQGVRKNTPLAMRFYQRAADLGHDSAQYNFGFGCRAG